MSLKIVRQNTDKEIEEHKIEKKRLTVYCRNCRGTYKATISEQMDDPTCRKCGK